MSSNHSFSKKSFITYSNDAINPSIVVKPIFCVSLRNYLDLKIDSIDLKTYLLKEEVKTKCYISEKNFPTAIERLQLIINNADNRADSLFAL